LDDCLDFDAGRMPGQVTTVLDVLGRPHTLTSVTDKKSDSTVTYGKLVIRDLKIGGREATGKKAVSGCPLSLCGASSA
jgi:hypothetical protein